MKQLTSELHRKAATRRKIQLGGLIIKAQLDEESNTVLLGILSEAANILQSEQSAKQRANWEALGHLAFSSA